MSVEAERQTLERKDRDELQKIAGALGGRVTSRTRKADIIDQILELTGVTGDAAGSAGKGAADAGSTGSRSTDAGAGETAATPADTSTTDDETDATPAPSGAGAERSTGGAATGDGSGEGDEGANRATGTKNGAADKNAKTTKTTTNTKNTKNTTNTKNAKSGSDGSDATTDRAGSAAADAGNGSDANGSDGNGSDGNDDGEGGRRRRRRGRNRDTNAGQDEFTGEPIPVVGCLDLRDDGYGFLRVDGLLPSKDDCYVSVKQVRQFGLRKGDVVAGGSRPAFRNEKNPAILRIDTVNDVALEPGTERPFFDDLAAVFPKEQVTLTVEDDADSRTARTIDLLAPVGKGSRVLLAAPPRTGATTLLQTIARSVEVNEPDVALLVVLLDERPEEITEMERLVAAGTVHGSAFDAEPADHVAVLELALARARRMAEAGDDVVVLVDGLTRVARADHAAGHGNQSHGRTIGGLDVGALHVAKRAFGAGRKLEDAGSITLVATATVDSDSDIDAAVHDAVRGAATTQIRLSRPAAERRSFPAVDVGRTSTRREELLVGDEGATRREALRRQLVAKPDGEDAANADGLDTLLSRLRDTPSNDDLLEAAAKEERS